MRLCRLLLLPAVLVVPALAGCGPRAEVATGTSGMFGEARRMLVLAAADGPVPIDVDTVPSVLGGGEVELAQLAGRAVDWSNAVFTPAAPGAQGAHLALRFASVPADPAAACAGAAGSGTAPAAGTARLHAIFCDGPAPVADAIGTAAMPGRAGIADLLEATLGRLFPGGGGRYGHGLPGVSVGVGVGSDGSGVGLGVGF